MKYGAEEQHRSIRGGPGALPADKPGHIAAGGRTRNACKEVAFLDRAH